jgi:flagellar hook protein FlgE
MQSAAYYSLMSGTPMSLYGIMKAGVSGMNAQSTKISAVADNIQNQNTTGYKRASVEFSSLFLGENKDNYSAGNVATHVRHSVSQQGPIQYTTSSYDLAIQGEGFFAVRDPSGANALTRAGAFVPTVVIGNDGNAVTRLVNAAGYQLLAQKLPVTGLPGSMAEMVPLDFTTRALQASPSTVAVHKANLPLLAANNTVIDSSMVVYDPLGTPLSIDVKFTKISATSWSYAISDRGDAALTPPRAGMALSSGTLSFDPATGGLQGVSENDPNTGVGTPLTEPLALTVPYATGGASFPLSFSFDGTTQRSADYTPYQISANGNSASPLEDIEIANDGTVYEVYTSGARVASYRIPLANVASPDRLASETGNVFSETRDSGRIQFGSPDSAGFGGIQSGALEGSNVDIGTELANMIEAQSAYTANSKIFQAGSELMDVLMNLKR